MQLAGKSCAICKKDLVFDVEATWCARCSTSFHRDCINASSEVCPSCHERYEKPEAQFVYSEQCPVCFRPNQPPGSSCRHCTARTAWDTRSAYENFLALMKDTSRVCYLRGAAELSGGIVCLAIIVCMFSAGISIRLGALVLGFMMLTTDGIVRCIRGRRIGRFR